MGLSCATNPCIGGDLVPLGGDIPPGLMLGTDAGERERPGSSHCPGVQTSTEQHFFVWLKAFTDPHLYGEEGGSGGRQRCL